MPISDSDLKAKSETMNQAEHWDIVKNRYLREGLCEKDAAQAAWGHQNGFSQINDPCEDCQKINLSVEMIDRHGMRGQRWLRGAWIKPIEN